ncbi:hypothetical protein J8N05_19010 [Streptomyces sp. BH-SS-21]|uniref:Uncharacterized protein n=1 Tax=Streptomyces liliiviolaceus TaxID=2823109 RepID=A0A940XZY1_9ACTN|nr:hypothetical protein [Streptomyces liliiviolaceus]MBQ0850281.1 hypothetical protein [Streptomyces liliiviolaceus]
MDAATAKLMSGVVATLRGAGFDLVCTTWDSGEPGLHVWCEADAVHIGWRPAPATRSDLPRPVTYHGLRQAFTRAVTMVLSEGGYTFEIHSPAQLIRVVSGSGG